MAASRALLTGSSFLASRLLQLVTGLILARVFGAVAWGAAGSIRAGFDLAIIFLRGGSEQILFKNAVGLDQDKAAAVAAGVWRATSRVSLLLTIIVAAALLVIGPDTSGAEGSWPLAVLIFAASVPLLAFSQTASSLSIALGRNDLLHLENLVLPVARFVAALSFVWLFPAIEALVASFLAASLLLAVMCAGRGPAGKWWRRHSCAERTGGVSEFVSLGANYVLSALVSRLDLLLVGLMVSMGTAGSYSILHSIAGSISVVGATQGRMLAPRIGGLLREGQRVDAIAAVGAGRRWTLSVAIPAVVAVGYGVHVVVKVLGGSFTANAAAVWLVAVAYGLMASFNYSGLLLSLAGMQRLERTSLYASGVTLVLSSLVFVPRMGMAGGALACLASVLVMIISREGLVLRAYREATLSKLIPINPRSLLAMLAPAVGMVMLQTSKVVDSPLELTLVLAGYVVGHAAIVYFLLMSSVERKSFIGLLVRA